MSDANTVLPVAIVDGTPNHAKLHRDANGQINWLTDHVGGLISPADAVAAAEAAQAAAEAAQDTADAARAQAAAAALAAQAAADQAIDISGIDAPDALVAVLVDGPSATASALSASYVPLGGTQTQWTFQRGADGEASLIAKPYGDGFTAARQLIHNDTAGFIDHLVSGPLMGPESGGLAGYGVGTPGIVGVVVDVTKEAVGLQVATFPPAPGESRANLIGLSVNHRSPGDGVRLSQNSADAGPILRLLNTVTAPGASQRMVEVNSFKTGLPNSGNMLNVYAAGYFDFRGPLRANGSEIVVTEDDAASTFGKRGQVNLLGRDVIWRAETGDDNTHWSHRAHPDGPELRLQSNSSNAVKGSETWTKDIIRMSPGGVGFNGAAPSIPARPTDVPSLIATFVALGLTL